MTNPERVDSVESAKPLSQFQQELNTLKELEKQRRPDNDSELVNARWVVAEEVRIARRFGLTNQVENSLTGWYLKVRQNVGDVAADQQVMVAMELERNPAKLQRDEEEYWDFFPEPAAKARFNNLLTYIAERGFNKIRRERARLQGANVPDLPYSRHNGEAGEWDLEKVKKEIQEMERKRKASEEKYEKNKVTGRITFKLVEVIDLEKGEEKLDILPSIKQFIIDKEREMAGGAQLAFQQANKFIEIGLDALESVYLEGLINTDQIGEYKALVEGRFLTKVLEKAIDSGNVGIFAEVWRVFGDAEFKKRIEQLMIDCEGRVFLAVSYLESDKLDQLLGGVNDNYFRPYLKDQNGIKVWMKKRAQSKEQKRLKKAIQEQVARRKPVVELSSLGYYRANPNPIDLYREYTPKTPLKESELMEKTYAEDAVDVAERLLKITWIASRLTGPVLEKIGANGSISLKLFEDEVTDRLQSKSLPVRDRLKAKGFTDLKVAVYLPQLVFEDARDFVFGDMPENEVKKLLQEEWETYYDTVEEVRQYIRSGKLVVKWGEGGSIMARRTTNLEEAGRTPNLESLVKVKGLLPLGELGIRDLALELGCRTLLELYARIKGSEFANKDSEPEIPDSLVGSVDALTWANAVESALGCRDILIRVKKGDKADIGLLINPILGAWNIYQLERETAAIGGIESSVAKNRTWAWKKNAYSIAEQSLGLIGALADGIKFIDERRSVVSGDRSSKYHMNRNWVYFSSWLASSPAAEFKKVLKYPQKVRGDNAKWLYQVVAERNQWTYSSERINEMLDEN